jgi:hypothetical protein
VSAARRTPYILAIVWCLFSPDGAHAQAGTIAGSVVEDGTSTPLAGYTVTVYDTAGVALGFVATDTSGLYSIPNLPPGGYYVKVTSASDHVLELHDSIACIAVDCPVTSGTLVTMPAASVTVPVNFSLAKGGTIQGTVTAVGSAVAGITVNIYNASTSFVKAVTTSASGTYEVKGLAAGTYLARTTLPPTPTNLPYVTELYGGVLCPHVAPEADCRIASGAPITVATGAITSGIDFALDAAGGIQGQVTVEGVGSPLIGVPVYAYAGDRLMGVATSAGMGQYSISGLPPGRYRLRTDVTVPLTSSPLAQYIDEWHTGNCVGCGGPTFPLIVGSGTVATGVNFALLQGGTITGQVICDPGNDPTAFFHGPEIAVFNATGEYVRSATSLRNLKCPTGSASAPGAPLTYSIGGLAPGTYYLWARDTPFIPPGTNLQAGGYIDQLHGGLPCNTVDCDVRKGVPVVVTIGGNAAANFNLVRGRGFVLPPRTEGVKVFDARGIETVNAIGLSAAGGLGFILVDGLPPGTYYVTAANGRLNGGITCSDCPPTAGVPIVITSSGASIAPRLTGGGGLRVSGTITNASGGAPLSTIAVEVVNRAGQVVASGLSDQFGHYVVRNLPAGTYFARTVNDRGFVDEIYQDAGCGSCDPRTGAPIALGAVSDVTGIDFALAAGGIISGQVREISGAVLGGVPVSLFAGTNTFAGVTSSSATGHYRATIPAGTYRALAEATTTKGSQVYADMSCTSAGCDPSTGTPIGVATGVITSGIDFRLWPCSAMSVTPSLLATSVVGTAYRQVLAAIGGTGPYAFDVTDGALPLGMTLNAATGVLSGTPTAQGRSTFRVSAVDANGCATDRAYVLDVQTCAFTLSPTSATLPAAAGTVTITIGDTCFQNQGVEESADWIEVQSTTAGQVTLAITANSQTATRIGWVSIGRRAFELRQAGVGSQQPYGLLELPANGVQVSGAVAIGGWALDDVGVTRVRIYRDAVASEPAGLVLIGQAVFIPGARPDVERVSPGVPGNDRAGFGFLLLTNTLPNQGNGTFRIHVIAEDAEGHSTVLGSRTLVGTNATSELPFGTIDTPLQGGTASGASFVNFGWALTPQPGIIPTDGSTIQVFVDGLPVGTAAYNFFRPDVSNTFPGLANSGGPVGYRIIDTTALAEGLHTISWRVTDSRPRVAGLGSRYFIVANSADAPSSGAGSVTATETTLEASAVAKPLGAAPAPDLGRRAESLAVDARLESKDESTRTPALTLRPMERLEVALDSLIDRSDAGCPATWAGYLSKNQVLSDLPVGTSLDPAGTFYWQTGPGFAGDFPLVFVRTDCRGEKQQVPVTVTIPIMK